MFRKFLCFIGWHTFKWSLKEHGIDIPKEAKCKHCQITYGKMQNLKFDGRNGNGYQPLHEANPNTSTFILDAQEDKLYHMCIDKVQSRCHLEHNAGRIIYHLCKIINSSDAETRTNAQNVVKNIKM
jgi:hypothetical protein